MSTGPKPTTEKKVKDQDKQKKKDDNIVCA